MLVDILREYFLYLAWRRRGEILVYNGMGHLVGNSTVAGIIDHNMDGGGFIIIIGSFVLFHTPPVKIDIDSEISPMQRKKISLFEEGLLFYRDRKWNEAKENFRKVISIEQADKPSEIYIERCDRFIAESPPDDWDGVFKFYTK